MGRQVRLADGAAYEPLTTVRGLPVFPSVPLTDQLAGGPDSCGGWHRWRPTGPTTADAETRVLRRGVDFDHVVLAVSVGMIPVVAGELIGIGPSGGHDTAVRTVATQAFQLWLRPDEPALGWDEPGVTISAYHRPFETWASMPQTLWANRPEHDRPGTVAYFCGTVNAAWPTTEVGAGYLHRYPPQVQAEAVTYIDRHLGPFFPRAVTEEGLSGICSAGSTANRLPPRWAPST